MERALSFTEEHNIFREAFRRFLSQEVVPHQIQWEEDGVSPRVAARQPAWDTDHLGDLVKDHARGRELVKIMGESFREGAHGDAQETTRFCQAAQEYIDLIRMHIYKEDRVVFPLMLEVLTPDDLHALDAAFAALATDARFAGIEQRCQAVIEELEFIYDIAFREG